MVFYALFHKVNHVWSVPCVCLPKFLYLCLPLENFYKMLCNYRTHDKTSGFCPTGGQNQGLRIAFIFSLFSNFFE